MLNAGLIIPIIFGFLFVAFFLTVIAYTIIYQRKIRRAPKLTVTAEVTNKRAKTLRSVTHHEKTMPHRTYHYHDEYFVTFKLENGESVELWLKLDNDEYDRLNIGDIGKLTYQGTKYIEFKTQQHCAE